MNVGDKFSGIQRQCECNESIALPCSAINISPSIYCNSNSKVLTTRIFFEGVLVGL
jgi:hypothetical protein